MKLAELLLPEFDQEMASTRKVLERIPEDKLDWRAHPKSNTIGWVGAHLAEIPGWVEGTLTQDSWDINPPGGEPYQTPKLTSRQQIGETFDAGVEAARKSHRGHFRRGLHEGVVATLGRGSQSSPCRATA